MDVPWKTWWVMSFFALSCCLGWTNFEVIIIFSIKGGLKFAVNSVSVYACGLMLITICFSGWFWMSVEFNNGSLMFLYVSSACSSCIEKERKLGILWRFSNLALFYCRKSNPINGSARLVMAMKRSSNNMSPTSNWSSAVVLGVPRCSFATNTLKSVVGPSFKTVCSASNQNNRKSACELTLKKSPASMKPLMVNFPNAVGKCCIPFLFLNWRSLYNSRIFMFFPRIDWWDCGVICVSMTGNWSFLKLCRGLIFSIGEVLGSFGLIVQKTNNSYLSLFDTCDSVIISSRSI